jgi:hypothetical protein
MVAEILGVEVAVRVSVVKVVTEMVRHVEVRGRLTGRRGEVIVSILSV